MDFKDRLIKACDSNEDIPPFGSGRQTEIARKMKVSSEAVRKWFQGASIPRPQAMKHLARMLGVDHNWLALGTDYSEKESLKKVAQSSDAATYAFCGCALSNGHTFALNDDTTLDADLILIKQGEVIYAKVLPVDVRKSAKARVAITNRADKVRSVIAARNDLSDISYDFFDLPKGFPVGEMDFKQDDKKAFLNKVRLESFFN